VLACAPMQVALAQGSLVESDARVLVNASNTQLALGSGVSGALRRACGEDFQERIHAVRQAQAGDALPPGEVLLTDAGAHPRARYVAHVAVMDYRPGALQVAPTLDRVRAGCANLWRVVEGLQQEPEVSVAMVALGAGTGGLGVVDSARIACQTLQAHWAAHPTSRLRKVTFYGFQLHEFLAMAAVVVGFFPDAAQGLSEEALRFIRAAPGR
jgi:O-acetyl-ADP-ribose deacetylase